MEDQKETVGALKGRKAGESVLLGGRKPVGRRTLKRRLQ